MDQRNTVILLLMFLLFQVLFIVAQNPNQDFTALSSLTEFWENKPPSWVGTDPCGGGGWEGIGCNNSRVISIKLLSMNLKGSLTEAIGSLTELDTLDLSFNKGLSGRIPAEIGKLSKLHTLSLVGCDFFGPIPESIGALSRLTFLALNLNRLSGPIPRTFGNLSNVDWLDIADNRIEGPIPVSDGEGPGLDMLVKTEHFHFGNNLLSGQVPPKLFSSNMILKHLLLDNNNLSGSIPSTMGLVKTLAVIRYDHNHITGDVPSSIGNLAKLTDLNLGNNQLNGSMPDLTGLNSLATVDLSNNSFNSSSRVPSWASSLPFLTTLTLEKTGLIGNITTSLFSQPNLETVIMRNNQLDGTLDAGSYTPNLNLVDLENNKITDFVQRNQRLTFNVSLVGNPICLESGANSQSFCTKAQNSITYSTVPNNCVPSPCSSNMVSSPNCKCAFPYTGVLTSRSLGFSNFGNISYYKEIDRGLLTTFQSHKLPVDSVSLSNPFWNSSSGYFRLDLQVFPSQSDRFNRTGVVGISFVLTNQAYKAPGYFTPYYFSTSNNYDFAPEKSSSKISTGVIAAAVAAAIVIVSLSIIVMFVIRQKKRSKAFDPFANWEQNNNSGNAPQLKGARWFSFEELKKYTNNFSDTNAIGAGGYGKVYQAVLPSGELVAVKRASRESIQGAVEFKTEIELLSRVHHKNLVGLVGFCYDKGEQMLVYEYVPNGTIMDSLSGKSGIRMNWIRRLKVTVGAARGLAYLHELADPPIIHRDIKSSNILLDDHLNAKVADFGLSKLKDSDRGHITTQVKGTMGYMDPEYYMTQQLTEKSDVYSFGITMLELVTARKPIEQGKFIVREVLKIINRSKELYNLHALIDPIIKEGNPKGLEKFVDLALKCVKDHSEERPTMADVVKEIENILQFAGFNPKAESTSTSEGYEHASGEKVHHPYINEDFAYTSVFPPVKVEPQ